MPKRKVEFDEFTCTKCKVRFWGLDSFHGEYRVRHDDVKNIQLCMKCLKETEAVWVGEPNYLKGQIEREIENWTRQHKVDRNADAKRIICEQVLDLMDNSNIFNGYNERAGYGRDLSNTELEARRIVHGEFKINFEEQVRDRGYLIDGVLTIGKKDIALEFDGGYWHRTDEQKERDKMRDTVLTNRGYKVVRIPEQIIKNDKSKFKSLLLDALFNVKRNNNKIKVPKLPVAPAST